MKLGSAFIVSICVSALCVGGRVEAKDKRDSITILPGGAHVLYTSMVPGKTASGKDALVFTGTVTLNIRKARETDAVTVDATHIEVIPLASQYNVFGPGIVRLGTITYKSDKPGVMFTFYRNGRQSQMESDWHKV